MKKVALVLLVLLLAFGLSAQKLVVWSFTNELEAMLEHYKADNPGVQIEFVLVPNDVYQSKLKPVLQSGQGAPDVFTLESAYVKGYVNTGWMGDVSSIDMKDISQYTKDVVTDSKGVVRALSWQQTPGAFYYRRSLAKKYLGTDDPTKVQAMMSDLNKFVATGLRIKEKSNGKCVIISSLGDLFQVFKSGRKDPWVKDGKLVIDPVMRRLMEIAKSFRDRGIDGRQGQWSEGWFAGMRGALQNEKGEPVEVFGYFLPTWGLHYVLKPNATSADGKVSTVGDWAMVQGPIPYFWGGTWIAPYAKTPNMAAALKLVAYIGSAAFQEKWAKETGDVVSNLKVVDKIKDSYVEPFLGGQNHYAAFAAMAKSVNAKILTGYDQDIESIFQQQMEAYVAGEKTIDKAIADMKAAVGSQFPDINVR
jgi:ABC-type glycerol-3-phosphate transport system substrate-binding protein